MTRINANSRIALAIAATALGALAVVCPAAADPAGVPTPVDGTMLPIGWELCILQGVSAPATQANVADLDEWQAAEGGSTNNTAAFNPFNTRRMSDVSGAPLPAVITSNGFPAFVTWAAGCAATIATLLQTNMSSIVVALKAGNVAPPGVFLAQVDRSQWCAPSSDGVPCYASTILSETGNFVTALLSGSSALTVYASVKSDVSSYLDAIARAAADQDVLAARNQQLMAARTEVSTAQDQLAVAARRLRRFAIDAYVGNGSMSVDAGLRLFEPSNVDGVLAQKYETVAGSNLAVRYQAAAGAVEVALADRDAATKAVGEAISNLTSDGSAENQSLARLVRDVATLQTAGACTTATITLSATTPPASAPPNAPTTTVPTTTVPANAPTTTVPTTTVPANAPTAVPTTTVPASTRTTPPDTTVPGTSTTGGPGNANSAGLRALQGCLDQLAGPGT